jgi:hypothetical protein
MRFDYKELREGEIFVGNTDKIDNYPPPHLASLKTIRLGEQAFTIHGEKIDRDYCRPVFIHGSEMQLYDYIITHDKKETP